jgi:predicted DNA-binding transcriptional regulator AlpA
MKKAASTATSIQSQGTSFKTRLLHIEEVFERTGLSRTKVYALLTKKEFPEPLKIDRCSRWIDDEITAWIESLRAARDSVTAQQQRKQLNVRRSRLVPVNRPIPAPVAFGTAYTRNLG